MAGGTYLPKYKPMIPQGQSYTYTEAADTSYPRDATFILRPGVEVWGGYNPSGAHERNPQTYPTTLSGDLDGSGSTPDLNDAHHVVLGVNIPANSGTGLDGLRISGGNAEGPGVLWIDDTDVAIGILYGGGMYNHYASPTLNNVVISGNNADVRGGGIYNEHSYPVLINVDILNNTTSGAYDHSNGGGIYDYQSMSYLTNVSVSNNIVSNGDGGGVYIDNSYTMMTNVKISGNEATGNGGGVFIANSSAPSLNNVTISGNKAANNGGGIYNTNASIELNKVTIAGNLAGVTGGGVYKSQDYLLIRNSIIWGNVARTAISVVYSGGTLEIHYSIVEGWTGTGTGNLALDPLFVDWRDPASATMPNSAGDYQLMSTSPAIKAGENGVDMGAYESGYAAPEMTRYVVVSGAGTINGSSWDNASGDLQRMMDDLATLGGGVVKLGAGTYKPKYEPNGDGTTNTDTIANRNVTFILRPGVEVWGGYPAVGGSTRNPDPQTNSTVLSGDIDTGGSNDAYHVVLAVNIPANSGTVLDGLTISGGYADGPFEISVDSKLIGKKNGGGIYNENSSPVLTNVTITDNYAFTTGGGIYNNSASPTLTNVAITLNNAGAEGGGMGNADSSPVLVNLLIAGNKAYRGGGIYNENSSPVLTNVVITGNLASTSASTNEGGGGMSNDASSPVLTNVTIAGNYTTYANKGGGIYNHNGSNPQIRNSIIWGNGSGATSSGILNNGTTPTISHSIVQGSGGSLSWVNTIGNDGGDNLDTDPSFISPVTASSSSTPTIGGDYRLNPGSPAIDAGDNSYYAPGETPDLSHITTDLDNTNRIKGVAIDMGAYEKQ
jgi:hypothetical protein